MPQLIRNAVNYILACITIRYHMSLCICPFLLATTFYLIYHLTIFFYHIVITVFILFFSYLYVHHLVHFIIYIFIFRVIPSSIQFIFLPLQIYTSIIPPILSSIHSPFCSFSHPYTHLSTSVTPISLSSLK